MLVNRTIAHTCEPMIVQSDGCQSLWKLKAHASIYHRLMLVRDHPKLVENKKKTIRSDEAEVRLWERNDYIRFAEKEGAITHSGKVPSGQSLNVPQMCRILHR